jgi:hypothetical protein
MASVVKILSTGHRRGGVSRCVFCLCGRECGHSAARREWACGRPLTRFRHARWGCSLSSFARGVSCPSLQRRRCPWWCAGKCASLSRSPATPSVAFGVRRHVVPVRLASLAATAPHSARGSSSTSSPCGGGRAACAATSRRAALPCRPPPPQGLRRSCAQPVQRWPSRCWARRARRQHAVCATSRALAPSSRRVSHAIRAHAAHSPRSCSRSHTRPHPGRWSTAARPRRRSAKLPPKQTRHRACAPHRCAHNAPPAAAPQTAPSAVGARALIARPRLPSRLLPSCLRRLRRRQRRRLSPRSSRSWAVRAAGCA